MSDGSIILRIVSAAPAELEAVDAIARESFDDAGFSTAKELERPWARVWIARPEGSLPHAFLVAWHVADELHILNIATASSIRGRGLGTSLMKAALEFAAESGVALVLLEVRRSNRGAIRFYRRLGFSVTGVRPGYYADNGEDAIEMILKLDPATGRILAGRDEIHVDV